MTTRQSSEHSTALPPHILRLADTFAKLDSRVPFIVFKLYRRAARGEKISLDADELSALLANENPNVRLNPEEAATLRSEFERFFMQEGGGDWRPRPDVFN